MWVVAWHCLILKKYCFQPIANTVFLHLYDTVYLVCTERSLTAVCSDKKSQNARLNNQNSEVSNYLLLL